MNIFVTTECPEKCAKFLDDKRLRKMCLETAQILSTAVNENGGKAPYKSTHKNHPACIWARKTKGNYMWLVSHLYHLHIEYYNRFGKYHKSGLLWKELSNLFYYIPDGNRTPFVNCAANSDKGFDYKHIADVYQAYRMYLSDRFKTDKLVAVCTIKKPLV